MVVKYYLKGNNKSVFYYIGSHYSFRGTFEKGRGWEFLISFMTDFPTLLNEITIINENDKEIETLKFVETILNSENYDDLN